MQHTQEDPVASGEEDDAFEEGKVIFYSTNHSPAQTKGSPSLGGISRINLKFSTESKVSG